MSKSLIALIFLCFFISSSFVGAVSSDNLPFRVEVSPKQNVKIGSLVSFKNNKFTLSGKGDIKNTVAVVIEKADLFIDSAESTDGFYLAPGGIYPTLVKGPVLAGDKLVLSSISGVATVDNSASYYLGVSLENYSGDQESLVLSEIYSIDKRENLNDIGIYPVQGEKKLLGFISISNLQDSIWVKYTGVLISVITVISGVIIFAKSLFYGVTSIGRNPLAAKKIIIGTAINVFSSIFLIAFGTVLSLYLFSL